MEVTVYKVGNQLRLGIESDIASLDGIDGIFFKVDNSGLTITYHVGEMIVRKLVVPLERPLLILLARQKMLRIDEKTSSGDDLWMVAANALFLRPDLRSKSGA